MVAAYIYGVLANKSFYVIAGLVIVCYWGLGVAYGQLNGTPLNILRLLIPALFTKSRRVSWLNPGWWTYYVASIVGGVLGAFAARFLFVTPEEIAEFEKTDGVDAGLPGGGAVGMQQNAKPMDGADPFN